MWTHSHAHAHACAHTYTSTLIYIHTHAHTTHTYVHTYYTHTLIYTHVHRHIHSYIHTYTCTYMHTLHTCVCVCTHCTHTLVYTHTHVPRHIYTHTHSYTHTCTHAHTHTRSAPLILPWAPGSVLPWLHFCSFARLPSRSPASSQDCPGVTARVVSPPVCSCHPWLGCVTPQAKCSLHPLFHAAALARYLTGHQGRSWRLEVCDQVASGPLSPEASLRGCERRLLRVLTCPPVSSALHCCPGLGLQAQGREVPRGQKLVTLGRQGGLGWGQGCQGADGGPEMGLKGWGGGSLGP